MTNLSQNDNRWKNLRLGTSNTTYGQSGCFVTSLAMLSHKLPTEVNALFISQGVYKLGCLVGDSAKAASVLGIEYGGKTTFRPPFTCISETNYYKPVVPQHFFVLLTNGEIIDPIDGRQKKNNYPIVSYRLFHEKKDQFIINPDKTMTPSQVDMLFRTYIVGRATQADVSFWTPQEEVNLVAQLCAKTGGDGKPSERFDLINQICKRIMGRDATNEEQDIFCTQRWTISEITKWALNK